jgi:hypothetical protein
MVTHTCPICDRVHQVREVRAALAYGRQLTCSPDCESARRKRMRERPAAAAPAGSASTDVASVLHTWVTVATAADLVRTAATAHRIAVGRR